MKPRPKGHALPLLIIVAAFIGFVFSMMRFWFMGDLSVQAKMMESGMFFIGITVFTFLALRGMMSFLGPVSEYVPKKNFRQEVQSFRAEDLAVLENELPELERPEVVGSAGKVPEELAMALRKLSESEGAQ